MHRKFKRLLKRGWKLLLRPWEVLFKEGPVPFGRAAGRKIRLGWTKLRQWRPFQKREQALDLGPPRYFDVICLPIINWGYRFQRPQHLSLQMAALGCRVFYGSIDVVLTGDEKKVAPQITPLRERIWEFKFPSLSEEVNIYRDTLEEEFFLAALGDLAQKAGISTAVLLVDFPSWGSLALKARERFGWKVIYDCMEDHTSFSHLPAETVEQKEIVLAHNADLVLAVSEMIARRMRTHQSNVLLVPNASDFSFFRYPLIALDPFVAALHPVIGYVGVVTEWFDLEAVEYAARAHPDWNFVIIGEVYLLDIRAAKELPNVMFMGEIPYAELPRYMNFFDVAVIAHKKSRRTDWAGSVKLYEYLSTGRPVVARLLEWLQPYGDLVTFYELPQEFVSAIEQALHEDTLEKQALRLKVARENSWENRGRTLFEHAGRLYPLASIIILTHDNVDITRVCLESIAERTDYPNYEVIVVDNASTDDTRAALNEFARQDDHVHVFFNETNMGFAAGVNQGVNASRGEYIVWLNNDCVVTSGWLARMVRKLEDASIGAVGPVTNYSGNESRIPVNYTSLEEMHQFGREYTRQHAGKSYDLPMLTMFCIALRREVVEKVGKLDERYGMGMFEDDDYAMRLRAAGYRMVCMEDVFVHHFGSVTFRLYGSELYRQILQENQKKFEEKWGVTWQPHGSLKS